MSPQLSTTLSDTPFIATINPGPDSIIPPYQTAPQIAAIRQTHTTASKLYKQYDTTDKSLIQPLLGAVDEMFIATISSRHIGFVNTNILQLLTHLYNTYDQIRDSDLIANQGRMEVPYDINFPIKALLEQIEDNVEYVAQGRTPFTNEQVVSISYMLVAKIGIFIDKYKVWRRMPRNLRIWNQFNIDLTIAYTDLQDTISTSRQSGYANNTESTVHQDTLTAIANLANIILIDRGTVSVLTTYHS